MLLTPAQHRFKEDIMQPLLRGEQRLVPEPVRNIVQDVMSKHADKLPMMSAEECTQLVVNAVEKDCETKAKAIIASVKDEKLAKELKAKLREGQLLVVRDVGAAHFNQLITAAALPHVAALDKEILTATLQFSTNDLQEVMNLQSMMHVVDKLKDQLDIVDAHLTGGDIAVDVIDRKNGKKGTLMVRIQPQDSPALQYEMQDGNKTSRVAESQLPEDYGNLLNDVIDLRPHMGKLALMGAAGDQADNDAAKAALLATLGTGALADAAESKARRAPMRGAAQLAEQTAGKPLLRPRDVKLKPTANVQKSKAATQRARAQQAVIEDQKKRYAMRKQKAGEEQELMLKRRNEQQQLATARKQKKQLNSQKSYAAVGAGLLAGASVGVGSASTFLLLLT